MKRGLWFFATFFMAITGTLVFLLHGCESLESSDSGLIQDISMSDVTSLNDANLEDNQSGENIIHKAGETIESSQKWTGTHILEGSLYIKSLVTIDPCTKILIKPSAKIDIFDSGSIKSIGTKECPVIFTSYKPSPEKGDWKGINIYKTSSNDNAFDYTVISYGGESEYGMLWIEDGASVKIDNTTFDNSSSYGVYFEGGAKIESFTGNKFTNLEQNPIRIMAGEVGLLSAIETSNNKENTIKIDGGEVTTSADWKNISIPYKVSHIIDIKAPVEVEGGTTLLIDPEIKIDVSDGGSFKLTGSTDKQISIKSSKPSPAAGDWKGINFYKTASNDNIWSYVNIMHGGGSDYGQVWVEAGATLTLNNCTFSDGQTCDLYSEEGANVVNNSSTYIACEK